MTRATVRRLSALAVAVACGCIAYAVFARPGGGQTYRGGGHSYPSGGHSYPSGGHSYSGGGSRSGGGGGGDGDSGELLFFVFRLLFQLCVSAPGLGIPLILMLVAGAIMFAHRAQSRAAGNYDWDGPGPGAQWQRTLEGGPEPGFGRPLAGYRALLSIDPDFSGVLFEDFVYALFAAANRARHDGARLAELSPYLEQHVREGLASRAPVGTPVLTVIVGAIRLKSLLIHANRVHTTLEIEANLHLGAPSPAAGVATPARPPASSGAMYVRETWVFHRDAGVRSRPPADVRTFACPNCGAPFESTDSQRCRYCHQIVSNGRFDWSVSSATLEEASHHPPALTGTVPELGTNQPTIFDPDIGTAWSGLSARDPAVTAELLGARLALIHHETTNAWNTQNLQPARGFVSDGLYDYLGYWTSAYRQSALRNIVEDARIVRWELVKLMSDRFYDALTLRVFATGRDFTLDARGSVVGGDRSRNRDYSEYWTLIRGASVRGAPRADKACPNCGAELRVAMSGQCEYCKARVTSGNFDWVLSKIEQDDSYEG